MNIVGFIGAIYGALMAPAVFGRLMSIGWNLQTLSVAILYSLVVFGFFFLGVKGASID